MIQPYRVLIADDHEHAREGMRSILEQDADFEIVAEALDGAEAVRLAEELLPDLVLMDINMPHMDGMEAVKAIRSRVPAIKIVMVTVSNDISDLFEALKKGAQGYLLKNLNPSSWLEYLRAVVFDEAPMSRELAHRILQEFSAFEPQAAPANPLTAREQEILRWVATGLLNREIAEKLSISEHTVKNHLKNILHKLQLENRVQLTRYAYEKGWVHLDTP